MPEDWDNARLENVKVGDNLLSINYVKNNDGYTLEVRSQNPDWNIEVTPQKGQITSKKNWIWSNNFQYNRHHKLI